MSRKYILIPLMLLLAVFTGCQKEDTVSLKPRSSYLDAGAGSVFVAVTATYDWTLSLEYQGSDGWASVTPASGTGTKNDVVVSFEANPSEETRVVTLVLKPQRGVSARVDLTQAGKTPEPVIGNYGFDVAPMDWLELPATVKGDGLEALVHNMQGGKYVSKDKNGTRNWTCYWDYQEHLSLWVAYPLNNALKGSGGRSNQWGWDALLPHNIQPDITQGSYGGGWTRGHQIPSADRVANNTVNASTFVPTNMTPQQYDFNCGIWAALEGKVRNYAAQADTLYVVTGCLYKNSTRISGNNTGFYVKIPTHYYKALLYKGSHSAAVTDGYMAVGFYLPHDAGIANGNCLDYICSIKELETQTGIDFFPNLAKRLGSEKAKSIEEEVPNTFWKK